MSARRAARPQPTTKQLAAAVNELGEHVMGPLTDAELDELLANAEAGRSVVPVHVVRAIVNAERKRRAGISQRRHALAGYPLGRP